MSARKNEKKAQELEYCRGWYDANGIWNNGFHCPRWGGPDRSYCCGTSRERFCCSPDTPGQQPAPRPDNTPDDPSPSSPPAAGATTSAPAPLFPFTYIPIIVGAGVGFLLVLLIVILCFCHPQCLYKRRKRKREVQNNTAPCPACRHTSRMPVVIANERGEHMSTSDVSSSNSRPPSYCPVCRAEGLRWQHGVNEVNILFPREDPPPYTDDGEGDKSDEDDKFIHYDNTLRFTSFMGSTPDITQTTINRHPPALLHHTDTHLKYLARTPDLTHHPISLSLYPGELSDDGSESSLSRLSRIPALLNTETRRLAMLRD